MNLTNSREKTENTSTLSDVFDTVAQCNALFKNNSSAFIDSFYQLSEQLQNIYYNSPTSISVALHNLNSNHSKDINFIAKAIFFSQSLSAETQFDQESQNALNQVTLFLALTLCASIKQANATQQSIKQVLATYPKHYYKLSKQVFRRQPSAFRLFTQIADLNDFKNKNQTAQTIILMSLNLAFLNVGLVTQRVSVSSAINSIRFKPLLVINKAFCKNHLHYLINKVVWHSQAFNMGMLVRTALGQYAFTLNRQQSLSGKVKWTVVEIDNPNQIETKDVNVLGEKDLLLTRVQPAIDYRLVDSLMVELTNYDVVKKYIEQKQELSVSRYSLTTPNTLNDFSKLLINATNKQIAEYLEAQPATAKLIQSYASNLSRVQSPIKDLKHAAALIGLAKLYPVVCNSEILKYQKTSHFIGSGEAFNKVSLLHNIAIKLGQDLKCDIPEYLGTVCLIMCHAVLLIPKGRHTATAGKLENKQGCANLAEFFDISNIEQWLKITGKMAREWQLPVSYLTLCKDYFRYIEGRLDPSALPRSAKTQLAALLMTHWVFIQIQSGVAVPKELPRTSLFKNVLGYSNSDVLSVYRDVIEKLAPHTQLL